MSWSALDWSHFPIATEIIFDWGHLGTDVNRVVI